MDQFARERVRRQDLLQIYDFQLYLTTVILDLNVDQSYIWQPLTGVVVRLQYLHVGC